MKTKFASFGSRILDKALVMNSELLSNELRVAGVSPLCINNKSQIVLDGNMYTCRMTNLEDKTTLKNALLGAKIDFLIIDFLNISSYVYRCISCETENEEWHSENTYFCESLSTLEHKYNLKAERVNPILLTDNDIISKIANLGEFLMSFMECTKIVLVKWQISHLYFEGAEVKQDDFDFVERYNHVLSLCENTFEEKTKCIHIAMPNKMIRLSRIDVNKEVDIEEAGVVCLSSVLSHITDKVYWQTAFDKYEAYVNSFLTSIKKHSYTIKGFVGEYCDLFNNIVESKCSCDIILEGSNSRIKINNTKLDRLTVSVGDDALVVIGNRTTCADNCHFIARKHKLILGDDDMVSTKVLCEAIDGDIEIGRHVWLGYQAHIVGDTYIGDGSIIGARTCVKGKKPNNCVVVGRDGRIARRDIYWEREPFTDFILQEEYANFTEEE